MHGNDILLIYEFNAYPGFFFIVGKSMYLRCLYHTSTRSDGACHTGRYPRHGPTSRLRINTPCTWGSRFDGMLSTVMRYLLGLGNEPIPG
ncbi:hypothetical protein BDW69DRAFT_164818, partial [Aspergillus filifer]